MRVRAEDAILVEGAGWSPSPAVAAALADFEQRVRSVHARRLGRAEPPPADGAGAGTAPASPPPPEATRHRRLRSVLDRMAVSARWEVEQDSWRAGIRLRYSRSVEFDPETASFALIEAVEFAPGARYRIVAAARPMKVVVRRTGLPSWEDALFTPPSRWLFFDRPNRIEEAQQIEPSTEILLSNEARFLVGVDLSEDAGTFPVRAHAGAFVSGEYFVRVKRLSAGLVEPPGNREWLLSAGGLITRGLEASMDVRTPEIAWGKRLRVFDTRWRFPTGARFVLRAGPLDLRADPGVEPFFRAVVGGAAVFRFNDFRLLSHGVALAVAHPEIGPELLKRLEELSNFQSVLAVARADPSAIPCFESVSRFEPRGHGEFGLGLWALVYGLTFASDWYAGESLVLRPDGSTVTIHDYPLQRRWDRGWVFFPRETRDLQIVTVRDARSQDLYTEVSLEIEDSHARPGEDLAYRAQVQRALTRTVLRQFPERVEHDAPSGPAVVRNELPELSTAAGEHRKVSIYLRLILGPRFHEPAIAAARDEKEREQRITAWQKGISRSIRRGGEVLEDLVRSLGTEDLYASYRIAFTPYARRKESPRPTTEYLGSLGDPERIPSYRRLRDALDDGGAGF